MQAELLEIDPVVPPGPPTLLALGVNPTTGVIGGNPMSGTVGLVMPAPAGGGVVTLTSSDPALVQVPPTVPIAAGNSANSFTITTSRVLTGASVRLDASTGGVTKSAFINLGPDPNPAASLSAVSVNPSSVVGGNTSQGTVTLTSGTPTGGAVVSLSSSNSAVAAVPATVTVAAGTTSATFPITTKTVTASTALTISGTFGGVSRTAALTVNPAAAGPSLFSVTVNPASVGGGAPATGTVTLTTAAPISGAIVALSSSNATVASVPASVTVAAGALSAHFAIGTTGVTASTSVTISGAFGGATRTATLSVNPASPSATLTVTATGRSGERVTSSPAGINVAVGSTGSATFATGTPITLTVSNGRSAIWSGACSSGGNKAKTCTFTVAGSASVSANVQ